MSCRLAFTAIQTCSVRHAAFEISTLGILVDESTVKHRDSQAAIPEVELQFERYDSGDGSSVSFQVAWCVARAVPSRFNGS
jgi:hypothetical protein